MCLPQGKPTTKHESGPNVLYYDPANSDVNISKAAPISTTGTAPLQTTDLSYSSGISRKPIYSSTISQGRQSAKFGD